MDEVFISYKSKRRPTAERAEAARRQLEAEGLIRI
jgi:hypothetical protein